MKTMILLLAMLTAAHLPAGNLNLRGPVTLTGTATNITMPYTSDMEVATLQLTGITGSAGIQLEGTLDDSTWVALMMTRPNTNAMSLTATANGIYQAEVGSFKRVRAKAHYIASGSAVATLTVGPGRRNAPAVLAAVTPTP